MKNEQLFSERLGILLIDDLTNAESDDTCIKINEVLDRGNEIEVRFFIDINEFPKFLNEDEAEVLIENIIKENSLDTEDILINCINKINSESDIVSLKNKLSNHNRDILKKLVE